MESLAQQSLSFISAQFNDYFIPILVYLKPPPVITKCAYGTTEALFYFTD